MQSHVHIGILETAAIPLQGFASLKFEGAATGKLRLGTAASTLQYFSSDK
jgi:hypothetical protein